MAGNLLSQGERYFTATGNATAATAAGYGSAALKGAGMGAAFGSLVPGLGTVAGAGIGAAAGLASEALDNLAKSAEKAAEKLEQGAKAAEKSNKHFENEMLRRQIEGVEFKNSKELKDRREFLMQDVQEYRNFVASKP